MAKAKTETFTKAERAAMRERAREAKGKSEGEGAIKEQIAQMAKSDATMARKVHKIVKDVAPDLMPRTWYGMPAYSKDGNVLVFFKAAGKFDSRYAELGFNDGANLDTGRMWPTAYALTKIGEAEEKKIKTLVRKAIKDK